MEKDAIEVKLSIEKNEAVLAHLVFRNKSGRSIYMNKQLMFYNGQVRNNYVEIRNSDDVRISYLGMMAPTAQGCLMNISCYILMSK